MFEHRLGLALHKSIGEVRAMPYPEYRSWELFYLLEPWGWKNDEYRTAQIVTMLHNINAKKGKEKKVNAYMRDMEKMVLDAIKEAPSFEELPLEERREAMMRQIKKDFGI